ncbi:MAG: hypothetical protein HN348_14540 [Proteobacteria bacterium]|jgi:hypothetical protein|nr:hypothetical protein [Pseudomonadota bacterium]
MSKITILSPTADAHPTSPLAVVKVQFSDVTTDQAELRVNDARHYVHLEDTSGFFQENITLLKGKNVISAQIGKLSHRVEITLPPSQNITIRTPGPRTRSIKTRAYRIKGDYSQMSCPAGVISVNGRMQQLPLEGSKGRFSEKITLLPGCNHIAIQIGQYYATKKVQGVFPKAKVAITLSWDSTKTMDLGIIEPRTNGGISGITTEWCRYEGLPNKLFISRRVGFGPQTYTGGIRKKMVPGRYEVSVKLYSPKLVRRTEWTAIAIVDEAEPQQRKYYFYGIFDARNGRWDAPYSTPPHLPSGLWNDICTFTVAPDSWLTPGPPGSVGRDSSTGNLCFESASVALRPRNGTVTFV